MSFTDDHGRLCDILEAIDKATRYLVRGEQPFLEDEMLQVWAVHHLQVIGEAANRLTPELRERHPEVPWRAIIAMRNVLVHEYADVDIGEIWRALTEDLPPLRSAITKILEQTEGLS